MAGRQTVSKFKRAAIIKITVEDNNSSNTAVVFEKLEAVLGRDELTRQKFFDSTSFKNAVCADPSHILPFLSSGWIPDRLGSFQTIRSDIWLNAG